MGGLPKPKPSILDGLRVAGIDGGRKVYKSDSEPVYYTWDSLHGEVEVFDKNGRHLGVVDPLTGITIKPAIRGRRIAKQN